MLIALVGNQNCGKTTLFNALTDSGGRVGNFPGVTVTVTVAELHGAPGVYIADLPGVYSLNTYSGEEDIAGRWLREHRPDRIINILDAGSLRRGLYLSLQVLELGIPTVLALNMMDEVVRSGGSVDVRGISAALGVRAVSLSAVAGEGIEALMGEVLAASDGVKRRACTEDTVAGRYAFIDRVCAENVREAPDSALVRRTRALDRVLLGRLTGIPVFCALLFLVFYLTFALLGPLGRGVVETALDAVGGLADGCMVHFGVHPLMRSFVMDGLFESVGSVVSFLPVILVLFFLLSLLEDSGYMARAAVLTDRPMAALGLSGRSFVPLMLGFGCSVPAIMATRTLTSGGERKRALMLTAFMSCSAKIPIYSTVSAAFFPEHGWTVSVGMYIIGIVFAVCCAAVMRCAGGAVSESFVMELPPYRLPRMRSTIRLMWERAGDFLRKAFTVILFSGAVIWVLRTFDAHLSVAADPAHSLLADICTALLPVFRPLGFERWEVPAALIAGLTAKEAVISTLAVLTGGQMGAPFENSAQAFSFLLFTLLYTPCVAAFAAARRELGSTLQAFCLSFFQCALAYGAAGVFYLLFG